MENSITGQIMRHLDLLDCSIKQSEKIKKAAYEKNIDLVIWETENRNKVINIVSLFQSNIEESVDKLESKLLTKDLITIIKSWASDVSLWVKNIDQIDQEIVSLLETEKEETTKEIATIFQSKNKFKGYNLNNVKK